MLLVVVILILAAMAAVPAYFAIHSAVNDDAPVIPSIRFFFIWMAKGVGAPIFVWILLNIGSMPLMPPLTQEIADLRKAGPAWAALMAQVMAAVWFIVPYWSSLTCGWCYVRLFKRSKTKDDMVMSLIVWTGGLFLLCSMIAFGAGWSLHGFEIFSGILAFIWVIPICMYSLNVADIRKPLPTYSPAIAKIKFGKYAEAEQHIISQLENSETDFDGWLMLAELYATQFNDMAEAEKCILDLCEHPETTISQTSIALHKLADWQLAKRNDPVAARRVLQLICDRMPGTHLSSMAANRIHSLPETSEQFIAQTSQRTIHMPEHVEDIHDVVRVGVPKPPVTNPAIIAEITQCVQQLGKDPNDVSTRERLAKLYVEEFGRLNEGIEQLELLIAMPRQNEAKIPEWIHLIAEWQAQHLGMGEEYQETLTRLVRQYPQSKQGFDAQRRLSMLKAQHRIALEPKKRIRVQGREEDNA